MCSSKHVKIWSLSNVLFTIFPIIYNFGDIFDCILSMPENQMTFLLKMVLRIWQSFEGLCRARGRGRCQNGNDLCGSGDYWMLQLAASVCSLDIWAKIPFSSISVSGEPFSATWPFFNTMIWSAPATVRMRWAMSSTVLFFISWDREAWIRVSFSTSRDAVASSKSRIGAFFKKALAMEIR